MKEKGMKNHYRGRGHFRGERGIGYRGERGEFRGNRGERGEFRGGRGDRGEFRGSGRGRGAFH